MSSLFITGATGFIGSELLRRLEPGRYECIHLLSRRAPEGSTDPHLRVVRGNLAEPESWKGALSDCDTVVHLAAATGRATCAEHFAINAQGTEALIAQCERAGVKNFLLVSTIACKYPNIAGYWYAESKRQGEAALERSRLNYAIVRPTIVVGRAGANWQTLDKLARLPVPVLPGSGAARIQPIHVEDLANCLVDIIANSLFANQVFELGGPEVLTFDNFMRRIHCLRSGRDASVLHLPLAPIAALLTLLGPLAPIRAGQLAAFVNDSTIEPNPVFQANAPRMKTVDQMLRQVISND